MQKSIDNAFRNHPRKSNNVIENEQFNICMVNGMNTNQLGVISKVISNIKPKANVRVTNIERTLIDITVRPVYSGGVEAIKQAYVLAKGKVSIEALRDMYLKLKYQYPYHQAIGYYLESTNYSPALVNLFQSLPMEFDFHLTNQMKEPLYIEKWKLYVPNNKIKDV
jgi:predicted transcriptional regulator of viral defense system